jgi:hypothetical protein
LQFYVARFGCWSIRPTTASKTYQQRRSFFKDVPTTAEDQQRLPGYLAFLKTYQQRRKKTKTPLC